MIVNSDLLVDQYADFLPPPWIWVAAGTPVSFSGCTATLMVRQNSTDASPLLSISTTSNSSGWVFLGPGTDPAGNSIAAGGVQVSFTHAATSALPLPTAANPTLRYSLLITFPSGAVFPFAAGQVVVGAGYDH